MPKEACRIFIEVVDVRAERLQDISDKDAYAEGIIGVDRAGGYGYGLEIEWDYKFPLHEKTGIEAFERLWTKINGPQCWKENPWVWVYEFKIIDKPKDF
ncbi:Phage-related protein [Sphingobacterium faecium PCAi_F2.5]|nr:Phage-related protein [Sphingobacterium faecium PCAi_F2.5]